mmetsp:Transcript_14191/g.29811  ORF Transcript_14191/g.29811 Transcript_14191/m.29811 type:complete len:324 (+) Transcript_14191:77-1048(+)
MAEDGGALDQLLVVNMFEIRAIEASGEKLSATLRNSSHADLRRSGVGFFHRHALQEGLCTAASVFAARVAPSGGTVCYDEPNSMQSGGMPYCFLVRRLLSPEHGCDVASAGVGPALVVVVVTMGHSGGAVAGLAALDFLHLALAGTLSQSDCVDLKEAFAGVHEHISSGDWRASSHSEALQAMPRIDGGAIMEEFYRSEAAKWKREGFWATSDERTSDLPWPEPNDSPWKGEAAFCRRLRHLERILTSAGMRFQYYGLSGCRVCKCRNGSHEYQDTDHYVVWPEGLHHYIAVHHVKPSAWFVQYVDQRLADEAFCFSRVCPLL